MEFRDYLYNFPYYVSNFLNLIKETKTFNQVLKLCRTVFNFTSVSFSSIHSFCICSTCNFDVS